MPKKKHIGTIEGTTFGGRTATWNCDQSYEGNEPHTHDKATTAARCAQNRLKQILPHASAPPPAEQLMTVRASVMLLEEG